MSTNDSDALDVPACHGASAFKGSFGGAMSDHARALPGAATHCVGQPDDIAAARAEKLVANSSTNHDDEPAVSIAGLTSVDELRELLVTRDAPALDDVFALIWLCGIR